MLGVLVRSLRRNGVVVLDDAQSTRPCQMNPATIDRRLASRRDLLSSKGRSYTKPGTLLKSQIPIRTWSEWDEGRPGFVEIDLVGHQGDNPLGEFSFTLTMTDVYSGFIINRSVKNKAAVHVTAAIDYAGKKFPFLILGIDSDSWSEFINAHLFDYCSANKPTFTRSRPFKKNDGAHVEQKNGRTSGSWSAIAIASDVVSAAKTASRRKMTTGIGPADLSGGVATRPTSLTRPFSQIAT
jgi:hypothetical protein